MKAAVLEEFHKPLIIKEVDIEEPADDEVTVEVKASGLCLTDVHISEGKIPTVKTPLIPGHETAGVIAKKGSKVEKFEVGDRVAVLVDVSCRECPFCLRGETNRCQNLIRIGFERNGGMAEYVNVPARNLEKIADSVSFEKAAIIPDAVACMYRGIKTIGEVTAGTRVAILGLGGLGMQGIKIAKLLGAHVTCTSRTEAKLERAKAIGADELINTKKESFLDAAKKRGEGFDVVIDNIGIKETVYDSVIACRNGGRVVVLGYVDPRLEIPSYEIVIREKQVMGVRALTRNEFREVIALVNSGQLDPDIEELIPISQINEAMQNLQAGKYLTRSVLTLPFD